MRKHTVLIILAVAVLMIVAAPSYALNVYGNPSNQSSNVSPDGTYNEGNSMQVVSDKLMSKCAGRGFATRDSNWLSLSGACTDAVNWGANAFIAIHTNATGSGGWNSTRGTMGLYYQSSGGWYDGNDRDLCIKCVDQSIAQFSASGRGAKWGNGYYADWPFYGYNLYVLANTPNMNSVLIEGLFHTNLEDTNLMKTDTGKNEYAEGLYRGICQHYGFTYGGYDIVVDNNSAGFAASANWGTYSSAPDKYGADYRGRPTAAVSDPTTWTINVPQAGNYDVYAWWSVGANRPSSISYIVDYNGGSATAAVNQQANGGKWNLLGRWNFAAGNNTIHLSCWAATGSMAIADAVRMVGPQ